MTLKVLKDVMLLPECKDRLGRKYDRDELYNQTNEKTLYGQIGFDVDVTKIAIDKISHQIKNIRVIEEGLIGDIHIMNTPMGVALNYLIDSGVEIQSCLRGVGNVDENNKVTDLTLYGFNMDKN